MHVFVKIMTFYIAMSLVESAQDGILTENAKGCDVTKAAVNKVETSGIFRKDHNFMLYRSAFMSDFGKKSIVNGGIGIWQLTKKNYKQAKKIMKRLNITRKIRYKLCVNFKKSKPDDMKKPLYSVIAASLLIEGHPNNPPYRYQIPEQAAYWMKIIGSKDGGISGNYQSKSEILERNKGEHGSGCLICKEQPTDILFIVDSSESVRPDMWVMQGQVVASICDRYEASIKVKQSRVGLIIFGTDVEYQTPFGDCAPVREKMSPKYHDEGWTRTDLALREAVTKFKNGGRMGDKSVKKLVFLITDGKSNKPMETIHYANAVKAAGIIIYCIGYRDVRDEEMMAVASRPEYYRKYETIDQAKADINAIVYSTCNIPAVVEPGLDKAPKPNKQVNIKGMTAGDTRYFQFKFDKYTVLALKFAPHKLTLIVYASFNQEHPSLFNHHYHNPHVAKMLKPNTKDTFIFIDQNGFLSDVCRQGAEVSGKKVNVAVLAREPSSVKENLNVGTFVKNDDLSKWADYSDAEDQEDFGEQVKKQYNTRTEKRLLLV